MKKIYSILVDVQNGRNKSVGVRVYDFTRETPKTIFGSIEGSERPFRKELEGVIKRSSLNPKTRFMFYTQDRAAIGTIMLSGIEAGLEMAEKEMNELLESIDSLKKAKYEIKKNGVDPNE